MQLQGPWPPGRCPVAVERVRRQEPPTCRDEASPNRHRSRPLLPRLCYNGFFFPTRLVGCHRHVPRRRVRVRHPSPPPLALHRAPAPLPPRRPHEAFPATASAAALPPVPLLPYGGTHATKALSLPLRTSVSFLCSLGRGYPDYLARAAVNLLVDTDIQ